MAGTKDKDRQTPQSIKALTKIVRDILGEIDGLADGMPALEISEIMTKGVPSIRKAIEGAEAFLTAVRKGIRDARTEREIGGGNGKTKEVAAPQKPRKKPVSDSA